MVVHIALDGNTIAFVIRGCEDFTEEEQDLFEIARQVELDLLTPDARIEVFPGRFFKVCEILEFLNG